MNTKLIAMVLMFAFMLPLQAAERPKGFPEGGQEVRIYTIDSIDYKIVASGYRYPVVRSAKIVTPELKRVFLFQVKPGTGAVIYKNNKGVIEEIWLLPGNYPLMED